MLRVLLGAPNVPSAFHLQAQACFGVEGFAVEGPCFSSLAFIRFESYDGFGLEG